MPMDVFSTDQLNATHWKLAKLAAFICFGLACCLLGASLVLSQPNGGVAGQGPQPRTALSAN
jgi:hypothetical protein